MESTINRSGESPPTWEIVLFGQRLQCFPETAHIHLGEQTLALTATEFRMLSLLLEGHASSYEELSRHVYGCSCDDDLLEALYKHYTHLRQKLAGTPLSVFGVHQYGYILLPTAGRWCRQRKENKL